MDIFIKIKKLASDIFDNHCEPIKIALKDHLGKDSFAKLRKGEIIISREMLRYHIQQALLQDPIANLDFIACTNEGVKIGVGIKKFKTHIAAEINMFIKKAVINPANQKIVIKVTNEKVVGKNLSGKLVSAIAGALISNIVKKTIISVDIPMYYSKKHNLAVLELHKIPAIRRMKNPLFGTKSLLDFISITRAIHTDAGIILKCKIKKRNLF